MSSTEASVSTRGTTGAARVNGATPAVLMSHPTGNQYIRNALRSMVERGLLAEFWTTVAWDPSSRWNKLLPTGVQRQISRRSFPEAPKERQNSFSPAQFRPFLTWLPVFHHFTQGR